MFLARVLGNVVATRKDGSSVGRPLVATDAVGAGPGEDVFYVRGREAAFPFLPREVPTDAAIVGIVDHVSGA